MIQAIAVLTPLYVTGFWAIVFLSSSRKKNRAKFFLGFFMVVAFMLYLGHSLFFLENFESYILYDPIYIATTLLVYPMYYQYTRLLTADTNFDSRYFYHYIPAAVMGTLTLLLHSGNQMKDAAQLEEYFRQSYRLNMDFSSKLFWNSVVYLLQRLIFALQVILYFWGGYNLTKKYRERLLHFYSNQEHRGMKWISDIFISLVIVAILSSTFNIIGKFVFLKHPQVLMLPSFLFSSMIFILGFLANGQNQVVREIELADMRETEVMGYAAQKQDDLDARLDELFRIEKIYLNPDLKIWDVSSRLGTNRTYLSNFINKQYSMNFSRYVNRYRVEEAKNLMSSPENKHYSLEVIGERCGFGSTNNFIRVFREFENMPPSSFRAVKNLQEKRTARAGLSFKQFDILNLLPLKGIHFAVGFQQDCFSFLPLFAFAVFHAEYTVISLAVDMFEDVKVINLTCGRFLSSGIIPDMESTDIIPGHVNVGNDIPFGDLLMVHIIDNLTGGMVNGLTDHVCLRDGGQEKPRVVGMGIQRFHDKFNTGRTDNITAHAHGVNHVGGLVIP